MTTPEIDNSNSAPLISVVVPIRNQALFIRQTVASLLSQTLRNFEIIAVENGSTDETWSILQELATQDSRLRLYQLHNCKGVSEARNYGMDQAQGDFLCFVDGDDIVFSHFLERLYSPFLINEIEFSICDMTYDGKTRGTRTFPKLTFDFNSLSDYKQGIRLCGGSACAKLYRKSFIQNVRFPGLTIGEDSLFMLMLYTRHPRFQYVPYIGYFYIQHPSSSIHESSEAKIDANFSFLYKGFEILENANCWGDSAHYWQSRAKTNSIERFLLIHNPALKVYWKKRFVELLRSPLFQPSPFASIYATVISAAPVHTLSFLFQLRRQLMNTARFLINTLNALRSRIL